MRFREPTFSVPDHNEDKLRELILYVASLCADHPRFGATKLNKILLYADFLSFAETGTPLTGVEYMRADNGPVPKRLLPIRESMIDDGEIAIEHRPTSYGKPQHRVVALRAPDLSMFTGVQISIVHRVISAFEDMTSKQVSDFSHGKAWLAAGRTGTLIPYEAVYLDDCPIDQGDIARTLELAEQLGWATN